MNLFCCCACCALQDRSADFTYSFQCSVLEIYNEQIYDLLSGSKEQDDKLDIKQVRGDKGKPLLVPVVPLHQAATPRTRGTTIRQPHLVPVVLLHQEVNPVCASACANACANAFGMCLCPCASNSLGCASTQASPCLLCLPCLGSAVSGTLLTYTCAPGPACPRCKPENGEESCCCSPSSALSAGS